MRKILTFFAVMVPLLLTAQSPKLTIEQVMQDTRWIGTSPSNVHWGADGKTLYFNWNPENNKSDSLYKIVLPSMTPQKVGAKERKEYVSNGRVSYTKDRSRAVWTQHGDVFYKNETGDVVRIMRTANSETSAGFTADEEAIFFVNGNNAYTWKIATGEMEQHTDFVEKLPKKQQKKLSTNEKWLKDDQLDYMQILQERKEKKEARQKYDSVYMPEKVRKIAKGKKSVRSVAMSPNGRFVSYTLSESAKGNKNTIIPDYVTESGFTTDINGRTKVGRKDGKSEYYVYDKVQDSVFKLSYADLPGIKDIPEFYKDYPEEYKKMEEKDADRAIGWQLTHWSPTGDKAIVDIYAADNKDRWIAVLDAATGKLNTVHRHRDEAWIGGPGLYYGGAGWINDNTIWYTSETTGYTHLYTYDIAKSKVKALTKGEFEVQRVWLSHDKQNFYIVTNETHPGEKSLYKVNAKTKKMQRLTDLPGAVEVDISPDESYFAIRHSTPTQPWELFLMENKAGAQPKQLTFKAKSDEFKSYDWQVPEVVTFKAEDGADVYARLYKPEVAHPSKPAVVFVHGAGYLQNAHKWWSRYYREYMFHNLLAENGYYVIDVDYRASAGYGRDWRTGIYRHMGGKDLSDQVDAVKYLVEKHGVNPENVGIYGGSYGGFITLMAMFNEPETFKSGAALRSVTDWANYNHGYTSNILNEPHTDPEAYRKSSPIYFPEGLEGNLLMAHGMVDVNVHYQDIIKLTQRLIELGKDNWELASYPMEGHGFVEPSSWTDEYKRIYKLFEDTLKE